VKALPPDPASPPAATVRITNTTALRIAAFKDDFGPSAVETHSYIFPARVPTQTRPEGASAAWIEDPPVDGKSYPAYFEMDASVVNGARRGYAVTNALLAVPTLSVICSVSDPITGQPYSRDPRFVDEHQRDAFVGQRVGEFET
jgi:glutamine synthetase